MRVELQIERARPRLIRDGVCRAKDRRERSFQTGYGLLLLFGGFAVLAGKAASWGSKVSASVAISMIVIGAFWSLRG